MNNIKQNHPSDKQVILKFQDWSIRQDTLCIQLYAYKWHTVIVLKNIQCESMDGLN